MLFELVTSIVGLALKPLLLAKLSCQFGFRSISIVILTWIELLRFSLSLHVMILCRLAMWAFAVLSLPVRAFTALHRERMVNFASTSSFLQEKKNSLFFILLYLRLLI